MDEWRKYNGSLIPIVPPHKNIDSSKVDQLIHETNSYLAMWTTDFDYGSPTKFWHIICDKFITFDNLSSNTRSKIRRSEKKFTKEWLIRTLSFKMVLSVMNLHLKIINPIIIGSLKKIC